VPGLPVHYPHEAQRVFSAISCRYPYDSFLLEKTSFGRQVVEGYSAITPAALALRLETKSCGFFRAAHGFAGGFRQTDTPGRYPCQPSHIIRKTIPSIKNLPKRALPGPEKMRYSGKQHIKGGFL
jgi:hypothetical protein